MISVQLEQRLQGSAPFNVPSQALAAVESLGEDARAGGLADAARAGEQVGVRDAAGLDRARQHLRDVVLADQVREDLRPVLERERAMGHGFPKIRRPDRPDVQPARAPDRPKKKGQGDQRHTRGIAYRCYLPVLTGFTSSGCAGPGP